jgi:hypothetical protein
MPRSGAFLEAAIVYYSTLARDMQRQLHTTQEDLRTGNFNVNKSLATGINFWLDATEGLWSSFLVAAGAPLPTAALQLAHPGTGTAGPTELRFAVTGDDINITDLVHVEHRTAWEKRPTFEKRRVKLSLNSRRDGLALVVTASDTVPEPGFYQGVVLSDGKPVGIVLLEVEEPPAKP